jgi:hypothetical protein
VGKRVSEDVDVPDVPDAPDAPVEAVVEADVPAAELKVS